MRFEVENYLVLEANSPSLSDLRDGKYWKYAVSGARIYPIEISIPIIRKGEGCIGLAVIREMTIDANSTVVVFTVHKCDSSQAKAYYNLYRNNLSMGNNASDDDYENAEDMVIPGLVGGVTARMRDDEPSFRPRPRFSGNQKKKNGWD